MAQVVSSEGAAPIGGRRASTWAWGVCWIMFASTVLNYMDRSAMGVVGEKVQAEFRLDNYMLGWVLSAFSLSYGVFQIAAGYLADRWDVRRTYAGAVAFWSLAAMATAMAPGLGALLACRALLGLGESFNWPCASRITVRMLEPADRSLGSGIFNAGAAAGAVLTPLLVTPIADRFGWRAGYLIIGALGFVWVAAWLRFVRGDRAVRIAAPAAGERSGGDAPGWAESLVEMVRLRRFWVMLPMAITANICWHFLANWLPKYLQDDRGMAFLKGGLVSSIPFLAAGLGNLVGGYAAHWLARRGLATARARVVVLAFSALLISCGTVVGWVENNVLTVVLLAVMALGSAATMANYIAFGQDVSSRHTGLIVGILGGLGNLAVAGFLPIAGRVKDRVGGFWPIFIVVGLLPYVGLAILALGWGRDEAEKAG